MFFSLHEIIADILLKFNRIIIEVDIEVILK